MGLPDSFLRLQGALTQLGWVFSLMVPVLDTLQLSTLCAYENFSKLTSLCNWDSLLVFLPKYTCLSLLFIFLYEPYVPPDCHYCNPHVRLCRVCLLPRTSVFSWLTHLSDLSILCSLQLICHRTFFVYCVLFSKQYIWRFFLSFCAAWMRSTHVILVRFIWHA